MPKSTKKPAPKAAKKATPKSKPTPAAKKTPATRAKAPARPAVARTAGKQKAAAPVAKVTSEAVALKAYYLAERRRHLGLPGDPQSDWLEAERLLRGS